MTAQSVPSVIIRGLMTGLLVTLLLLFAKWCAEHTALYQGVQKATYSWLLTRLESPSRRSDVPVVILDIRDLEYKIEEVDGQKFPVTPREPLLRLIEAVVEQKPKAVGVDIDFSPQKIGYGDPDDPIHFRKLIALRQSSGVPIFLGINRSQHRIQTKWLGDEEFASLAANIDRPEDNRKMYEWTSGAGVEARGDITADRKGLTMSKALARAIDPAEHELSKPASWIVHRSSETNSRRGLKASDFLVDFSALGALRDYRLKTIKPDVVRDQGWVLADKAVLIGDGTLYDARDTVIVPLSAEKDPVPGIYLHASAVYTLIKAPLLELTGAARLLADVALALVVLTGVMAARAYVQTWGAKFAEKRTAYIFIFIVTLIAIAFGIVFLHKTRVIWDDFVFVLIALWIHPIVETRLWQMWQSARTNTPLLLKKIFSEKGNQEAT